MLIQRSNGKSTLCALRPTQKPSSPKKVAALAKRSGFANHATFASNASSMRWLKTSVLEFGAGSLSVNAAG
jgi:hypothetical protein